MEQPGINKTYLLNQYRDEVTDQDDQHRGSPKLHSAILVFLFTVSPKSKFSACIQAIITCSIENIENWRPLAAANAFRHIEKFALNILNFPWQVEFSVIKLYTGFWKLKIEQHLDCVMPLFKMLGYEKLSNDVLKLKTPAPKEVLTEVAFDCFIAYEEMKLYEDIYNAVDYQGFSMLDVHKCRTNITGNKDTAIDWITRTCKPTFRKVQNRFEHESMDNNLPPPPPTPATRSSYTDSEFPPPPSHLQDLDIGNTKDVITRTSDSGYASHQNSKRFHISETKENDYISASVPEVNREISVEDEMFKPKTYEDHLKLLEKHAESSTSSGSKSPKSGSMNDWEHVTVGLKKKFGDDYYAGLRGDIINIGQKDDYNRTTYNARGVGGGAGKQIVTADVHNDIRQRTPIRDNISPHKQPPASPSKGKHARISKSTNKPSSPQAYVPESTQHQLGDMVAKSMRIKTDSSPDISRPPVTFTSQGSPYQPRNFSTFGVDQLHSTSSKVVEVSDSYEPHKSFQEEHEMANSPVFGQPEGFSDGLTRRMYQADSQTSLNKEQYVPVRQSNSQLQDEAESFRLYTTPKVLQYEPQNDLDRYSQQRAQHPASATNSFPSLSSKPSSSMHQQQVSRTAPLLPKRTAPTVPPRRQNATAPLVPPRGSGTSGEKKQQCPHCTFANPLTASVCAMCHRSMDSRLLLGTLKENSKKMQCTVCTLVNEPGETVCKACANPLQTYR